MKEEVLESHTKFVNRNLHALGTFISKKSACADVKHVQKEMEMAKINACSYMHIKSLFIHNKETMSFPQLSKPTVVKATLWQRNNILKSCVDVL